MVHVATIVHSGEKVYSTEKADLFGSTRGNMHINKLIKYALENIVILTGEGKDLILESDFIKDYPNVIKKIKKL